MSPSHKTYHVCFVCLQTFLPEVDEDVDEESRSKIKVIKQESKNHEDLQFFGEKSINEKVTGQFLEESVSRLVSRKQISHDLYLKFLRFLSKYLNLWKNAESFLRYAKEVKNEDGERTFLQVFCDKCSDLVNDICEQYRQLEIVEMLLKEKLNKVGEVMDTASTSGSKKLQTGLMTMLTKYLNLKNKKQLKIFREIVRLKCKAARKMTSPKVLVPRGLCPELWKFSYSSTRHMLMRLIIVFSFAHSPVQSKSLEDIDSVSQAKEESPPRQRRKCRRIRNFDKQINQRSRCKKKAQQGTTIKTEAVPVSTKEVEIKAEANFSENIRLGQEDDDFEPPIANNSGSDWSRGASPVDHGYHHSNSEDEKMSKEVPKQKKWNLRTGRKTRVVNYRDCDEGEENVSGDENYSQSEEDHDDDVCKISKKRPRKTGLKSEENTDLKCPECSKVCADRHGLKSHMRMLHGTQFTYPCNYCDMTFSRRNDLKEHTKKGHFSVETPCPKCSKIFPTRRDMNRHKNLEHKKNYTKFVCHICNRVIAGDDRYKSHLELHEKNRVKNLDTWYCEVCGKVYFKEITLTNHMKEDHDNTFPCALCHAKYDTGKLLRNHLLSHETEEKLFTCQMCFRTFSTVQLFDIHKVLAHKDKRKFFCSHALCVEDFETISELNEHLKIHLEEEEVGIQKNLEGEAKKIMFCKVCEMGFLEAESVTIHELLHTPISKMGNGYDCPKCSKKLGTIETLIVHYKLKHCGEQKSYYCRPCKMTFSDATCHNAHRIRFHTNVRARKVRICSDCGISCKTYMEFREHCRSHKAARFSNYGSRMQSIKPRKKAKRPRRPRTQTSPEELGSLTCQVENCGEDFPSGSLLRNHLIKSHEDKFDHTEKTIPCFHCHQRFAYSQTRDMHCKQDHDSKTTIGFKCDDESCELDEFNTVVELNQHLNETHLDLKSGKSIHFCKICNWGFMRPELRDLHELLHLEKGHDVEYCCVKCPLRTESMKILQLHFNVAHGIKKLERIKCDECNERYFSVAYLSAHKIRYHETKLQMNLNKETLVCDICGVDGFEDERLLEQHIFEHNPENHVLCTEPGCDQKFENWRKMHIHRRRCHYKGPGYVCHLCAKVFIYKFRLKQHILTHQEAHWECPICGLKVSRKLTLDYHMKKKHDPNRDKDHVCQTCGKSYFSTDGLKYHFMAAHVPESEWRLKCPNCPRRFYRKLLLDMHKKSCCGENGVDTNTTGRSSLLESRKATSSRKRGRKEEEEITDGRITENDSSDDNNHKTDTKLFETMTTEFGNQQEHHHSPSSSSPANHPVQGTNQLPSADARGIQFLRNHWPSGNGSLQDFFHQNSFDRQQQNFQHQ